MSLFVNPNGCNKLPILRTKDLCFLVRITNAKFLCSRHAKKCSLENVWITSALSPTLCRPKLEFFSTRVHASDTTLEVLIIGHYLKKCLD